MIDTTRFNFITESLSRSFASFGLEVLERTEPKPSGSDLYAVIAQWSDKRPSICVWYARWFVDRPEKYSMWVGFQGSKIRSNKLRDAINSGDQHKVSNFVLYDKDRWRINNVPSNSVNIVGEHDSEGYYIGFYEDSLDASSDEALVAEYFCLISNIILAVEPPVVGDIGELNKQKAKGSLDATTYERLIQARRGQGRFRQDLDDIWGNRCAVSNCSIYQTLRASHIKPWRSSNNKERLDPENGLLLNAILDSLFDRGLISFNDGGEIIISRNINQEDLDYLRLHAAKLSISPSRKQQEFLKYHREKLGINLNFNMRG